MLPRERRLRQTRDINRVYSRGRFGGGSQLSAKAMANGLSGSRAAVVVSKKISKKAVVRNRIRRRLASLLAETWQHIAPGYDIVITVREDLSQLPADDLKTQLSAALSRCGVVSGTKPKESSDV